MTDENRSNVILLPLFRYQQRIEQEKRDAEALKTQPDEPSPPPHELEPAIEAILFAMNRPVSVEELNAWLSNPGKREIRTALRSIQDIMKDEHRGTQLREVARGWQIRTAPRFSKWVALAQGGKPTRLSKAALEALSIVAYRQPVTRNDIDDLRGVDSGAVVKVLIEHNLIEIVGRKQISGTPLLYGTTDNFLSLFNLRDLADLPTLSDLRELEEDERGSGDKPQLDN